MPNNPLDLKVIIKQVLTDPLGLNLPTRPSTAMVVGNAIDPKGNWTGVYGHSQRSIAIYGESEVYAGFFAGDVLVNGDFIVETGSAHFANDLTVGGKSISELIRRITALEASNAALSARLNSFAGIAITLRGTPIAPTTNRPVLNIVDPSPEFVENNNTWTFHLEGTGFTNVGPVEFSVLNVPHWGQLNKTHAFTVIPLGGGGLPIPNAQGVFAVRIKIVGDIDDQVAISATQRLADLNDVTGQLYSNQLLVDLKRSNA